MTSQENNSTAFIITGMHRSGTSLTASLMQSAGVHIGERLMGIYHSNQKGHFENLDFVGFHEHVLCSQGISQEGWTLQSNIQIPQPMLDKAKLIIAENVAGKHWGWKDPRTTLFLNFWQNLLPQAYFVFTYRSPWEVIDSLYRRSDTVFYDKPQYALQIWIHYNKAILNFYHQFPNQSILLNIDNVIVDPTIVSKLCNYKFDVKLGESSEKIVDKSLMKSLAFSTHRQMLIKKIFPEAMQLYDELNKQADSDSLKQADAAFQLNHLNDELEVADTLLKEWVLKDWLDVYRVNDDSSRRKLERVQLQLQLTQQHSQNLEAQLQQLQLTQQLTQQHSQNLEAQLQLTQQHSQNLEAQLQLTQQHSQNLEAQLQLTQQHSQNLEAQMQNSKLWQLREKLLKLKKVISGSAKVF